MLLAIDTSTTWTGLACYTEAGVQAECAWNSGRNHTAQLLPQLQMLLQHSGFAPADIRGVAVALGPGSWSGLRVGISVAKGMAVATGLPIIGVGTLDVIAAQHPRLAMPLYPLIRLGRDRFATAEFRHDATLQRIEPDHNTTLAELCATIDDQAFVCGDVDDAVQRELHELLGEQVHFPTPGANVRRAGFLAALAWQRFVANDYDDPIVLEPVYLGEAIRPRS